MLGSVIPHDTVAADDAKRASWQGLYVGLHAGYGMGRTGADCLSNCDTDWNTSFMTKGPLGGAHAGYNIVLQNILLGVEGDYSFADIEGDRFFEGKNTSSELEWLASARVRAGVLVNPATLLYATGGLAWGEWKDEFRPQDTVNTWSSTRKGYVVGGGVERKLSDDFSVRLEYTYTDFGSETVPWTEGSFFSRSGTIEFNHEVHAMRVGFSVSLP